jgi:phytanoyl-CoA hydroxylase
MALTASQLETFREDGYLILPRYVSQADCEAILADARAQLAAATLPLEFEADVGYAGAPTSREAEGGQTVRRLLKAYDRGDALRGWATRPDLIESLAQIFGEDVVLTLAHHNCVMTKHPHFGTATGWHRDIRYWSFPQNSLISVWLALGPETKANGALRFIPGSHREQLGAHQLDALDFVPQRLVPCRRAQRGRYHEVLGRVRLSRREQSPDARDSLGLCWRSHARALIPAGLSRSRPHRWAIAPFWAVS